jgi:hypothetical protein
VLGTSKGVRFCTENSGGGIDIGPVIPTGSPVLCFEPQERFIWYGLTNYDSTSTGLGRLDPTETTGTSTPAWASDLMVTGQGDVQSVVTFQSKRVFTVAGAGVYQESPNLVASGILDTGLVTFGIPDNKVGMYADVKLRQAIDTNRAYISVDGSAFALIGTRSSTGVDPFPVGQRVGGTFELRHELLNALDTDMTVGPVLTKWTLRAYPNPPQGEVLTVNVLLFDSVTTSNGNDWPMDPTAEYQAIRILQQSRQLVAVQIGTESLTVLVDDHQFSADKPTGDGKGWQGVCALRLKALAT